ncbi:MAG: hypothetical protein K0U36_01420, partial [Alphaproteobacteria bacterium]|nr:hypothetical protein [Alphaproteobacteria bacterium]
MKASLARQAEKSTTHRPVALRWAWLPFVLWFAGISMMPISLPFQSVRGQTQAQSLQQSQQKKQQTE